MELWKMRWEGMTPYRRQNELDKIAGYKVRLFSCRLRNYLWAKQAMKPKTRVPCENCVVLHEEVPCMIMARTSLVLVDLASDSRMQCCAVSGNLVLREILFEIKESFAQFRPTLHSASATRMMRASELSESFRWGNTSLPLLL